jgi:hypothetical protein
MAITLDGTTGITTPGLTNTGTETIVNLTTTGNTILGDASTDTLNVGNGGLVKDASGNVGIGGSAVAGYKLDIVGSAMRIAATAAGNGYETDAGASTLTTSFNRTTSTWLDHTYRAKTHVWNIAGSSAMALDASGNLGVGFTSLYSSSKFQVQVSTGEGIFYRSGTFGSSEITFATTGLASYSVGTIGASTLKFNIGGTQAMTLDASGNLLVGTTSGSGYRAEFTSNGVTTLKVQRTSMTGPNTVVDWFYNTTNVGSVAVSSTATSYNTSSDYRLKNSVSPMTGALAKVAALKPCTYKWNADNSDSEGFIAHELAEVMPHAVTGEKDAVDANGNPVYQGIDTSFLIATLTAAIQEQQAMIDELKAKVAALEAA